MSHTQDKWTVEDGTNRAFIVDADNLTVAEVHGSRGLSAVGTACLLAAAPAMLEELRTQRSFYHKCMVASLTRDDEAKAAAYREIIERIQDVISLAEGVG